MSFFWVAYLGMCNEKNIENVVKLSFLFQDKLEKFKKEVIFPHIIRTEKEEQRYVQFCFGVIILSLHGLLLPKLYFISALVYLAVQQVR